MCSNTNLKRAWDMLKNPHPAVNNLHVEMNFGCLCRFCGKASFISYSAKNELIACSQAKAKEYAARHRTISIGDSR